MDNYIIEPQTQKIQNKGLEILLAFHEICEANQLKYILDFGTLLGAVRHEGFIPWDDDIDVAMPRKDFENFKRIAVKELPENMFLQNHESDPNYYNYIAKIRLPDDNYVENAMQYFDIVHGPWLDIFIYDYTFDDKTSEQKKQKLYNKQRNFYPFMMGKLFSNPTIHYNWGKKTVKRIFQFFIRKSQKSANRGLLMRYLDRKYEQLDALIRSGPEINKSGDLITYTFPIHSDSDEKGLRLNTEHFENRKLQLFEEHLFYIPINYKQLLIDRYGNYMELPPYEERKSNHFWVKQ